VWWIRQSILQALAEQSRIVRLPLNKIGAINKINKTFSKLEQELEREPSYDEISEQMDLMPEDISDILRNSNRHMSMDAPLSFGEDAGNMYDLMENDAALKPDRELLSESLKQEIDRALSTLTGREADVVKLFFGLAGAHAHTLEEIGEKFELTRERVRQIKEKAVRRLKHGSRSKLLKAYLG
jgi:RNA polymerase primary sigma factor